MALGPVALAITVAVVVALVGARFVDVSAARHWSSPAGRAVAVLVLPLVCFGVALAVDANAFICAFVAGLVFGSASSAYGRELEMSETLDSGANLIGYVVWFLAGGLVQLTFAQGIRWQWIVIAVAALTVLRILPVAISLVGTGLRWQSVLFVGWFGPRGLATIVFALLAFEELGPDDPVMVDIAGIVAVTVILSVFAHGISSGILARTVWAVGRSNEARGRTQGRRGRHSRPKAARFQPIAFVAAAGNSFICRHYRHLS
ncbi:MAG: cation:proton antiporter [Candidatus Nanopelagicales bacterium]